MNFPGRELYHKNLLTSKKINPHPRHHQAQQTSPLGSLVPGGEAGRGAGGLLALPPVPLQPPGFQKLTAHISTLSPALWGAQSPPPRAPCTTVVGAGGWEGGAPPSQDHALSLAVLSPALHIHLERLKEQQLRSTGCVLTSCVTSRS